MIIFRYFIREIYLTLFSVTSILLLIFLSNQFVRYWADAAVGRLTVKAVLQIMAIQVPLLLGFMLPLGLFLGILLAYGRLYADNEMTVLTACGVSREKILVMTLIFAFFVALLDGFLMLWLQPKVINYREQIIAKAAISSPLEKIAPGGFQKISDKWIIFAEKLTHDRHQIQHVFAAELPGNDAKKNKAMNIIFADNAQTKENLISKDSYILLSQGSRYIGEQGKNNYQIVEFDKYAMRLPSQLPAIHSEQQAMSTSKLWQQQASNPQAAAELQWRLSLPLSVLILTLYAVPLSRIKPRQGRFAQLLPAIAVYIVYLNLLYIGETWVQKGKISSDIGMWWIHILMLVVALLLLSRQRIMR